VNIDELKAILADHRKWLTGTGGNRAALRYADFNGANLSGENFGYIDLSYTRFRYANFSGANLSGVNLSYADLSYTRCRGANFSDANLGGVNFSYADLSNANFTGANLRLSRLDWADLSGSQGLLSSSDWLARNFAQDKHGLIVYKARAETQYKSPPAWRWAPNEFLTEVVSPSRTDDCGCGVHFATREWIKNNLMPSLIWRCRIRWRMDLASVVVPYNTAGKARCGRLELLEIVE